MKSMKPLCQVIIDMTRIFFLGTMKTTTYRATEQRMKLIKVAAAQAGVSVQGLIDEVLDRHLRGDVNADQPRDATERKMVSSLLWIWREADAEDREWLRASLLLLSDRIARQESGPSRAKPRRPGG